MPPQSWAEYRLEAFGEPYMVWHDGPDFYQFRQRAKEEPATAERVLLEGLAEHDPVAAQAIVEADFDDATQARLVEALKGSLASTRSTFRVRVAEALTRVTGEQRWSEAIVEVLLRGPFWGDRLEAAMALGRYQPTIELIAALMRGVHDPDYLVRYHSANSLRRYAGIAADVSEDEELFAEIAAENAPEKWLLAASGLAGAASAGLRAEGAG